MKILFMFLIISQFSFAKSYLFKSYDEAKASAEYIKLEGESTKFGLVTTSFDGFAKSFELNLVKNNNFVKKIEVHIDSPSIDTDNNARNKKMYEKTLSISQYPKIIFKTESPIDLNLSTFSIPGKLKVRDTEKEVILKGKIINKESGKIIEGEASVSLQEFNIPDPSIFIAKVRDRLDLKFKVFINE